MIKPFITPEEPENPKTLGELFDWEVQCLHVSINRWRAASVFTLFMWVLTLWMASQELL